MSFVLAIDQGTTSSRAIVFRGDISIAAVAQQEFPQHFPASGWVEHEPEDIWRTTVETARQALSGADLDAGKIAGAVAYLASDASTFMTGQTIVVDGGVTTASV